MLVTDVSKPEKKRTKKGSLSKEPTSGKRSQSLGQYIVTSDNMRNSRPARPPGLTRLPRDTPLILWSLRFPEDPWGCPGDPWDALGEPGGSWGLLRALKCGYEKLLIFPICFYLYSPTPILSLHYIELKFVCFTITTNSHQLFSSWYMIIKYCTVI